MPTLLADCHHLVAFGWHFWCLGIDIVQRVACGLLKMGCIMYWHWWLPLLGCTGTNAGCCLHPLPLRVWDISCLFYVRVWAPHGWHMVGTHTETSLVPFQHIVFSVTMDSVWRQRLCKRDVQVGAYCVYCCNEVSSCWQSPRSFNRVQFFTKNKNEQRWHFQQQQIKCAKLETFASWTCKFQ